jgi:hypothetical protein
MTSPLPNDQLITQVYLRLDIPSDTLVRSPTNLGTFVQLLPAEYRATDCEQLAHRIVTLRKKGMLPRLRRAAK